MTQRRNPDRGYRRLEVYQLAHSLGVEVHKASLSLPKFELYEEGQQVRRSAKSVSANIVEGYCRRRYKSDFIRFLVYAHASCEETIEHLDTLHDTGSMTSHQHKALKDKYDELGAKINRFISAVESGHDEWPDGSVAV